MNKYFGYIKIVVFTIAAFLAVSCGSFQYNSDKLSANQDNVAYFQEKNKIYWQINRDPSILNNEEAKAEWFKGWPEDKRVIYIKEAIDLYNNKSGK